MRLSMLLTLFGVCTGVGAVAGRLRASHDASAPGAETSTTTPTLRSAAPSADERFANGPPPPAPPLEVTLEPAGVARTPKGDVLSLTLGVEGHFEAAAKARYAFEVVTDTGAAVVPPVESPVFALAPAQEKSFSLAVPALPTGFYLARATTVAKSAEHNGSALRTIYLQSVGGNVTVVDDATFQAKSKAKQGHP